MALFYRRKFALALLEAFEGKLSNLKFQKLLFIATSKQQEASYYFLPYRFGCFSFQSYADRWSLAGKGYLKESGSHWILKKGNFLKELTEQDRTIIQDTYKEFKSTSEKKLIRTLYLQDPYYAINSEILDKVLSEQEKSLIQKQRPLAKREKLFTIGYEGISVEQYVNKLIKNNIGLLCDVRKNPLSRKYGFSKRQLQDILNKLGIDYLHIPELGISSGLRQDLNEIEDYKKLFQTYKSKVLPKNKDQLNLIMDKLKTYKRVAMTCFEAEHSMCHRGCVSEALVKKANGQLKIEHL